ncbi:hypothetical protein CPB84DRAFT_236688 [Gymnopilus junonius]|uniref:Uncharacterized protein n=1 Tax=Gymnopilus junonius TaxID=109634 RepID=A0A9P5NEL0_GYMJU|nr:hypothetical protein CPB84DRAFT_236688 [Gymnopilus junonius]
MLHLGLSTLRRLTLSFKHCSIRVVPRQISQEFPEAVFRASRLSSLSLPSLCGVSVFMGSMPLEVHSRLQEIPINTLNLSTLIISTKRTNQTIELSTRESQPNQYAPNAQDRRICRIHDHYDVSQWHPTRRQSITADSPCHPNLHKFRWRTSVRSRLPDVDNI